MIPRWRDKRKEGIREKEDIGNGEGGGRVKESLKTDTTLVVSRRRR